MSIEETIIQQDFEYFVRFHQRLDHVEGEQIDCLALPYCFIKRDFIQFYIEKNNFFKAVDMALTYLKFEEKKINTLNKKDKTSIFFYLFGELLTEEGIIYQLEKKHLYQDQDFDLIKAGVNQLAPFNYQQTIYNLANKNVLAMMEVEKLPYSFLLDLQVMISKEAKVSIAYQKIIAEKKTR